MPKSHRPFRQSGVVRHGCDFSRRDRLPPVPQPRVVDLGHRSYLRSPPIVARREKFGSNHRRLPQGKQARFHDLRAEATVTDDLSRRPQRVVDRGASASSSGCSAPSSRQLKDESRERFGSFAMSISSEARKAGAFEAGLRSPSGSRHPQQPLATARAIAKLLHQGRAAISVSRGRGKPWSVTLVRHRRVSSRSAAYLILGSSMKWALSNSPRLFLRVAAFFSFQIFFRHRRRRLPA